MREGGGWIVFVKIGWKTVFFFEKKDGPQGGICRQSQLERFLPPRCPFRFSKLLLPTYHVGGPSSLWAPANSFRTAPNAGPWPRWRRELPHRPTPCQWFRRRPCSVGPVPVVCLTASQSRQQRRGPPTPAARKRVPRSSQVKLAHVVGRVPLAWGRGVQ